MTPEQLRRIDALIAEKVCGWRRGTNQEANPNYAFNEAWKYRTAQCWFDTATGVQVPRTSPSWQPTTDPVASKMLRKKLSEQWTELTLYRVRSVFTFKVWTLVDGVAQWATRSADTEEMAVALTACAAFGIEVEL